MNKRSHWPAAVLGIVIVMALTILLLVWRSFGFLDRTAERVFGHSSVTHSFTEALPQITSTHGDVLELATSRVTETFTRSDSLRIFGDRLDLGTTTAEIRVPATYRYHLKLSEKWQVTIRDGVCFVIAPKIRPSLPPAIDTAGMEKRSDAGWLRFNAAASMSELERGITPQLSARALQADHLALVREPCRQSVRDFVRKWLIREEQWNAKAVKLIAVSFADETEALEPVPAQ